jgi:hypothetical protein
VKQTKKSKVNRTGKNDVMKKLIEGMSKLVLTATQAVTEKVTTAIRQIPIYIISNFAPSFRQIGR